MAASFDDTILHYSSLPSVENAEGDNCLSPGFTNAWELRDGLMQYMERHVRSVDKERSRHRFGSASYIRLMATRLFTFGEYQLLFDLTIPEKLFSSYPVFEYLMLTSHEERLLYIQSKKPHEDEYLKILQRKTKGTELGKLFFRPLPVSLPIKELQRHVLLVGRSGAGKSELLKVLLYHLQQKSDTAKQFSLVLIDPHGDLAEAALQFKLNLRQPERLIYVDPYLHNSYTPVINPLQLYHAGEQYIDILCQELCITFNELMGNSTFSLQMETLLIPCLSTLLRLQSASLRDLQQFMDDKQNKDLVSLGLKNPNPGHREFFKNGFTKPEYAATKTAIYTRLQSLMNSRTFFNLTQGKSTVNIEKGVRNGGVLLFNLAKGKMGTDASLAFGKFLLAQIKSIAFQRASLSPGSRKQVFLFLDEFQNYIDSPSLASLLTEARKYGISLILATQTLAALDKTIREVILSNTAVKMIGENAASAHTFYAKEMGLSAEQWQSLERTKFFLKSDNKTPILFQVPSMLAKGNPRFISDFADTKRLKKYLVEESGAYEPLTKEKETEIEEKSWDNPVAPNPKGPGRKKPKYDL
ncbi:MAG: hypothetical protein JWQ09_3149 [Segetibacter sp.]|nr:hypothetical protein [Segetibacter sp.]